MYKEIILTIALLALPPSLALSQPGMMGMMGEKLKLSDQQVEQMQKLHLEHQRQMIQKKADMAQARLDLKEIMMSKKIDEKAALARQEKISGLKAQIAVLKLQQKIAMRKILNDDQLEKWMQMQRHMKGPKGGPRGEKGCCMGRGPMMGPGHGMGPGMMGPGSMMNQDDDEDEDEENEAPQQSK